MKVDVSESTFSRLKELAEPLIDSADDVIVKLLEAYEATNRMKVSPDRAEAGFQQTDRNNRPVLKGFQLELWDLVIDQIPFERFSLSDVYARMQLLEARRPQVQKMRDAIRAALQSLRDKGYIEFLDNRGQYRKRA